MTERGAVLHIRSESGGGGGADSVVHDLAAGLKRAGVRVVVCYLYQRGCDISPLLRRLESAGVTAYGLAGRRWLDVGQLRQIVRIIRENEVGVVHCHDYKADFYGVLLRRRFPSLRLVSTAHGWNHTSWKGAVYDGADKLFLRGFDLVIAVSAEIMTVARRWGIVRVRLLQNAVDTECWRREPPLASHGAAGERTVGFVGRFSREKGPLDFVRVAARVAEGTPCRFVMAGEGPEGERLSDLIGRSGLAARFDLPGQLDRHQLKELYHRLDVLVLPSYSEGIPLSVLEALAMEVPVVATRVGGVGEVVRPGMTGLLCEAGDVEGLASQVTCLLRDRTLAATLSRNGRALVEREFSLRTNVAALLALYRE